MVRRVLPIALLSLFVPSAARADDSTPTLRLAPAAIAAPKAPDPARIAARDAHIAYETQAMSTLMAWAVASVATGTMLLTTSRDNYVRAVGVQNVAWGAIDGAIAAFGYRGIHKQSLLDKPVIHWKTEDQRLRKIFLINAGLDVLYIAAGAAFMGLSKNEIVRGSGAGVIFQGSFLLAFDGAMGFGVK